MIKRAILLKYIYNTPNIKFWSWWKTSREMLQEFSYMKFSFSCYFILLYHTLKSYLPKNGNAGIHYYLATLFSYSFFRSFVGESQFPRVNDFFAVVKIILLFEELWIKLHQDRNEIMKIKKTAWRRERK